MIDLSILNNEYFVVFATLFLTLYITIFRINLPSPFILLFQNNIFRVVFLSLLLMFRFEKSPHVAVLVSLSFILIMYHINQEERRENFKHIQGLIA
jgi:cbb3-type cytochrome oxidase subunit 3